MTQNPEHLPAEDFRRVREQVPILCVDVLPRRAASGDVLLIRRRDRAGALGWNLVGGRVLLDEELGAAVSRHVRETLGAGLRWDRREWEHPDLVAQYRRQPRPGRPFDPAQHAVALSYVISTAGAALPGGEALDLAWFEPSRLPPDDTFGFGQGAVARRLLELRAGSAGVPR